MKYRNKIKSIKFKEMNMSNGLTDPSLSSSMNNMNNSNLMMPNMMVPSPQSLQMVPTSSTATNGTNSPMNLNMINNMSLNMNMNGIQIDFKSSFK